MTTPSFRDVERLSAYLDGQLSGTDKSRLEAQLKADPALMVVLNDLRQTRAILRRVPRRRAPRNFTLSPKMAGIRPPVPRAVPVLSWASAVAMLLFVGTVGINLLGQLPVGLSAQSADHFLGGRGGGPAAAATAAPATAAPAMAPVATEAPASGAELATASPVPSVLMVPEPTQTEVTNTAPQPFAPKLQRQPISAWLFIWPGLAILLIASALILRWRTNRAFSRKHKSG